MIIRQFIVMVCLVIMSSPVLAKTGDVVATVDFLNVVSQSKSYKQMQAEVESEGEKYQKEIGKKERELQENAVALEKQRSVLSKEALEEKVKKHQKEVISFKKEVRDTQVMLQTTINNAVAEIQKNVLAVIKDICNEKGYSLAVQASQVLYQKHDADITEEVLKRLDKRLPEVEVSFDG